MRLPRDFHLAYAVAEQRLSVLGKDRVRWIGRVRPREDAILRQSYLHTENTYRQSRTILAFIERFFVHLYSYELVILVKGSYKPKILLKGSNFTNCLPAMLFLQNLHKRLI